MEKLSKRLWASFLLLGLMGQFAWTIENMYFKTARNLSEAMEMAETIVGKQAKVTVIPDGVSVIVEPA